MPTTAPQKGRQPDLAAENERLRARVAQLEAGERERAELLIENARLFSELNQRNATLKEVLDQQTATADILRSIRSAPTSLDRVLEEIIEAAARLTGADSGGLHRIEGGAFRVSGRWRRDLSSGPPPPPAAAEAAFPSPSLGPDGIAGLPRTWAAARALQDRATLHIPDIEHEDDNALAISKALARQFNHRSLLMTPILSGVEAVGVLSVQSTRPRAFTDRHASVLETFADQAVIAIENARLFQELQESNATLKEALEQQTATGEILNVIAANPADLQRVLDAICAAAARLCGAGDAVIARVEGGRVANAAQYGALAASRATVLYLDPAAAPAGQAPLAPRDFVVGRTILDRATIHIPDLDAVPPAELPAAGPRRLGVRTMLSVPLLREGEAIGALYLRRLEPRPFTDQQIRLIESFADQAVIAIENARLFSELQERLVEQTATADVLRVISESPTDLGPVLDAIVGNAMFVCDADDVVVFRVEGDEVMRVAARGPVVAAGGLSDGRRPIRLAGSANSRALLERRTIHIADMLGPEADEFFLSRDAARRHGVRSYLAAPMLLGGAAVGLIQIRRREVRPFTERQIRLLEGFASQAAIAMENTRLFAELRQSNATLKETLEQQAATEGVLRVIASNPTDLQRVLDEIASTAVRLCGSDAAVLHLVRGDELEMAAAARPGGAERLTPERVAAVRTPIEPGRIGGRVVLERRTIHLPDTEAESADEYPVTREHARRDGWRCSAFAPLVSRGAAVGVLGVANGQPGSLSERQIALLETLADQAVIAIENARLFSELQESNATLTEKTRQLEEALDQQTATAEVLRVIAASPSDLARVLHTIAERAARLCDATDAAIFRVEGDDLRADARHGLLQSRRSTTGRAPLSGPLSGPGHVPVAAVRFRRTIHLPDVAQAPEWASAPWGGERWLETTGIRSRLGTPLLRQGAAVGALVVDRAEARPYTDAQVKLLESFADQAAIAIENTRLFTELQQRDERRRHELERASVIQRRLLPSSIGGWPGLLEIAVRFRPAVETSGDFYDVLRLSPATEGAPPPLQIAVGDVAGKGMSAALVTALARSALRASTSIPTQAVTPAGTLRVAGSRLHQDVGGGHFVACALAVVEPPGLHNAGPLVRLANAAQVPVLLVRDGTAREIEPPGYRLPLGAQPDGAYEDAKIELRPGDAVVFSSDGLVEAPSLPAAKTPPHLAPPDSPGDLFGFARLAASASHWSSRAPTAEDVAQGIWSDLTAWCAEDPHHDDMTLLVLRVPHARERAP